MSKHDDKRLLIAEKAADHLLTHGLADFTLRTLGAAIGTSDRMLLHYFHDKHDLLANTLTVIVSRLIVKLQAMNTDQMTRPEMIRFLTGLLEHPDIVPYNQLWLELAAIAHRQGEPFRSAASQIADTLFLWIKSHLKAEHGFDSSDSAAEVLTYVEGVLFLSAVGKKDLTHRALKRHR